MRLDSIKVSGRGPLFPTPVPSPLWKPSSEGVVIKETATVGQRGTSHGSGREDRVVCQPE